MNPASGGEKCRQNMNMGAKSATKTTKWGQKAPPHKSEPKKCGGKKCRQNAKVEAKSAVKMQKWGQKAPSKQQSDGKKRHHISNCGGILTTTYHIQGAGAPAKTKNFVNADGVYIFSGKGPTFSASCKTYEHIFKKGWKSNGTDKKRLV